MTLYFRVLGVPVPQGSKQAFVRGGRAVMRDDNSGKLKPWRTEVANAAREAHAGRPPFDGALQLDARFVMPRPASARKKAHWCTVKPDLDKLLRALGDSLTMAGVIRDDARFAEIRVLKVLANVADPWTGVDVAIRQMDNGESALIPLRTGRIEREVPTGGRL